MRRLLFVCVGNAGRSQMAEALARAWGGDAVDARSGGTRPAERVSSKATAAMREWGIELSGARPKPVDWAFAATADAIVDMGCGDSRFCPVPLLPKVEDWDLDDPVGKDLDAYRAVRDEVARRMAGLFARLGLPTRPAGPIRP